MFGKPGTRTGTPTPSQSGACLVASLQWRCLGIGGYNSRRAGVDQQRSSSTGQTVARPIAVRPTMMTPLRSKCSSLVLARVKQPDKRAAFRVKPAQVRPLVRIAVVTAESEVSTVVASAMLTSDDMLDVICEERLRVLRQVAVFAAMTSPLADKLPER